MKLTAQEISVCSFALQCKNEKREARVFGIGELKTASTLAEKLNACTEETTLPDGKMGLKFVESELELSTNEKSLALKCVDELSWSAMDGGAVLSLKEKLN